MIHGIKTNREKGALVALINSWRLLPELVPHLRIFHQGVEWTMYIKYFPTRLRVIMVGYPCILVDGCSFIWALTLWWKLYSQGTCYEYPFGQNDFLMWDHLQYLEKHYIDKRIMNTSIDKTSTHEGGVTK